MNIIVNVKENCNRKYLFLSVFVIQLHSVQSIDKGA